MNLGAITLFLLTVVIFCRLFPHELTPSNAKPPNFDSIRFASSKILLNSLDLTAMVKGPSHLALEFSKVPLCRVLISWLIVHSGDIELNPGPPRKYTFPCGVCAAPFKCDQKGILCEMCNNWLHARCNGMSSSEYLKLQKSDDSWSCRKCLCLSLTPPVTLSLIRCHVQVCS